MYIKLHFLTYVLLLVELLLQLHVFIVAVFVLRIMKLSSYMCVICLKESGEVYFEDDRESARLLRREQEAHRR